MYQVDLKGTVIYQTFGCSHDIGGRLIADSSGNFPFVCIDDGFGIERPLNTGFGDRAEISQETTTASAGWSPATMGSLVKRNTDSGYVLAYLTKHGQLYYQIKFILFDKNMQKTVIIDYTLPTGNATLSSIEHYHLQLMPYGAPGSDQYLIYYTNTVMSTIACCTANIEERCFGTIESKMYQLVTFKGDVFKALSDPVNYDMSMDAETTADRYANGDLIWGVVDNTNYPFYQQAKQSVIFNRVKNC